MLSQEELQKLAALLNHLHQCMGVKFGLMNEAAIEIYTASDQAEFCAQIQRAPGGLARCMACDRAALRELQVTQKQKKYRCHCGLTEVAMPVVENGRVIAYILFGQFLDSGDRREQWAQTRALISWHPETRTSWPGRSRACGRSPVGSFFRLRKSFTPAFPRCVCRGCSPFPSRATRRACKA